MSKVKSLISKWQKESSSPMTDREIAVLLTLHDSARIEALTELYPEKTKQQIITELLSAALDDLEEAFPYIKGEKVIAHDEFGDPIFEDAGKTSTFIKLTNRHLEQLKSRSSNSNNDSL